MGCLPCPQPILPSGFSTRSPNRRTCGLYPSRLLAMFSERLARLACRGDDTAGVVHLDMCRAAGMTAEQIGWLVESGRWQSPFPRTYVTFSGPMPVITVQHAAL